MTQTLYHVTPAENYAGILAFGLQPQIGERSQKLGAEKNGVFLFPTRDAVDDAMGSWLGEAFADRDHPLMLLSIELSADFPLEQEVEWERISRITIPVDSIHSIYRIHKNDPPLYRGQLATSDSYIVGHYQEISGYPMISDRNGPLIVRRSTLECLDGEPVGEPR